MKNSELHYKKSKVRTILWLLVFALILVLVSFTFLYLQIKNSTDHVSGRVISVNDQIITIVDAQNNLIEISADDKTKVRNNNKQTIQSITPGTFIRSTGEKIAEDKYHSLGIRILSSKQFPTFK